MLVIWLLRKLKADRRQRIMRHELHLFIVRKQTGTDREAG